MTDTTFYEEKPGLHLPAREIRDILRHELKGKLAWSVRIHYGDKQGHCPTLALVDEILARSRVDRDSWIEERHDCDDFAWRVKADFVEDARNDATIRSGHAFGIIWGQFVVGDKPVAHALNWFIGADSRLWLVEPQSDEVFMVRKEDYGIHMVIG